MLTWPLNVPVLTDGFVTLRAHTPADIDRAFEMACDPDMIRWTAIATPHTREMSEWFHLEHAPACWNDGTSMLWAIEFEGRFAGNVELRGPAALVDIGYALHPDCRGHNVMSAAVNLAIDHAFTEVGTEVVQWRAAVGNEASLRVAWACGFRLHEFEPDMLFERGKVIDAWTGSRRFGDAPTPRTRWLASRIDGDGFVLRPPSEADLPRWVEAENDEVTSHWAGEASHTIESITAALHRGIWLAAKGQRICWTIADPHDDHFLGQIMISGLHECAEIGYFLHLDARGRGLTKRALAAAVDYAFSTAGLNLHRLDLFTAVGNKASQSIARACGFEHVGTRHRAERLLDGTQSDLLNFERLRSTPAGQP